MTQHDELILKTCPPESIFKKVEKSEEDKQYDELIDCMEKGISPCCKAPIDESRVIKTGRHKNHGPRFCSKCKRCVFMV